MPVMVTGTDNAVGLRAATLLAGQSGEVRAFVQAGEDEDVEGVRLAAELRALGCKVAHGWLDDEAHVETALEQVHTVLHLLGRPTDDPDAYLDRTATVISAAIGAGCRRLVLLSDLAVQRHRTDLADNDWLRALAEAEEMAAEAPLESVVLRCAAIHGPDDPLTIAVAAGALGADPTGSHWPVAATDVATTALLADDERDLDTTLHVVVSLAGPVKVSTAAYAGTLATVVPRRLVEPPRCGRGQSTRRQGDGRAAAPGQPLPAAAAQLLLTTIDPPSDALGRGGTVLAAAW